MTNARPFGHLLGLSAAAAVLWHASAIAAWVSASLSDRFSPVEGDGDRVYHFIGEVHISTPGWVFLLGVMTLAVVAINTLGTRGVVSAPFACLAVTLLPPGILGLVGAAAAADRTAGLLTGVAFGTVLALGLLLYWATVFAVEGLRNSPATGAAGWRRVTMR